MRFKGDIMNYTYEQMSKMIDHSLLNPLLTDEKLEEGIATAIRYDTASVCIMPFALRRAAELLSGSGVLPTTTVGFPHGVNSKLTKLYETETVMNDGAKEIDMVVNIAKVLSGDWNYVYDEIHDIVKLAHDASVALKVIFENCYLDDSQKIRLCEICGDLGADWVKTSTGYGSGGAELSDLHLMRTHSAAHVQLKAAGGVRTLDRLIEVREAGCSRAGATATAAILDDFCERQGLAKR